MATIMLVEDDETMRSLLKILLEIEGFTVAFNLETTVETITNKILQSKPDGVMMDVHLKEVSGMAVLKNVRSDEKGKSIKIIMASGMDAKEECLKTGADYFIMKPFNPEELIKWLKKALNPAQ